MTKRGIIKKLAVFLCAFFMLTSIFVKAETVKADEGNSWTTDPIDGSNLKGRGLRVRLYNHDSETFKGITVSIEGPDGLIADPITYTSLNDATSKYQSSATYVFVFYRDYAFDEDEYYTATVTVDTGDYKNQFQDWTDWSNNIFNACMERLEITKTWNDNGNPDNLRPDADTYAGYINLDGKKPTKIVTVSDSNDTYKYVAYGNLNIQDSIVISEDSFENYICTSSQNSEAYISYDSFNMGNFNVSRASLTNTKYNRFFDVRLLKTDNFDNPLENVEFTITNIGTNAITYNDVEYAPNESFTVTTPADGELKISNLPSEGKYRIEETNNPHPNFKTTTYSKDFGFGDSKEVDYQENNYLDLGTIVNDRIVYADFILYKKDSIDKTPMAGISFEVKNAGYSTVTLQDGREIKPNEIIETIVTDENGIAKIEGLSMDTYYSINEVEVPQGYNPNSRISIYFYPGRSYHGADSYTPATIDTNAVYEFNRNNERTIFGGFKLIKRDMADHDTVLKDAVFELYYVGQNDITLEDETVVSQFGKIGDTYTTDENGEILVTGLPINNRYYFKEITAPEGYYINPSYKYEPNTYRYDTLTANEDTNYIMTIYKDNKKQAVEYFGLNIEKMLVPSYSFVNSGKFAIVNASGQTITDKNGITYEHGEQILVVDMSENPNAASSGYSSERILPYTLEDGTPIDYHVYEIEFPTYGDKEYSSGYGEIRTNYYDTGKTKTNLEGWEQYPLVGNFVAKILEGELNPTLFTIRVRNYMSAKARIVKTEHNNSNVRLAGAKFDIYFNPDYKDDYLYIDGEKIEKGTVVATITTNERGIAETEEILPQYTYQGHRAGYYWREIEAPENYYIYYETGSLSNYNSDSYSATVTNIKQDYRGFRIIKVDYDDRNIKLKDAKFEIIYSSSSDDEDQIEMNGVRYSPGDVLLTNLTTDENGVVETGKVLPLLSVKGNRVQYRIRETHAPAGYRAYNRNSYSDLMDVGDDGYKEITVSNMKTDYYGFRIIKRDSSKDTLLPGAKFEIYNRAYNGRDIVLKDGTIVPYDGLICTVVTDENGIAETEKILPLTSADSDYWVSYLIKEVEGPEGYRANYSSSWYLRRDGSEYTEVNVYNDRDSAKLIVEKLPVNFADFTAEDTFSFDIELNDNDDQPYNGSFYYALYDKSHEDSGRYRGYGLAYPENLPYRDEEREDYEKITFVDGKASVDVPIGAYLAIFDIPVGFKYEVSENNVDGYVLVNKKDFSEWNYDAFVPGIIPTDSNYVAVMFINNNPNIPLEFEATKLLEGRDLKDKEFTFELKDDEGNVVATATNAEDGSIRFEDVKVDPSKLNIKQLKLADASDEEKDKYDFYYHYSSYNAVVTKNIPDDAVSYMSGITFGDATDEQKMNREYDYPDNWQLKYDDLVRGPVAYYYLPAILPEDGSIYNVIAYIYDTELNYTISEVVPEEDDLIDYDRHLEAVKVKISGDAGKQLDIEYIYESEDPVFINTQNYLDIEISKTDLGGKELPGAEIQILLDDEVIESWTSSNKPHVVKLLPGTYTFHEEVAPEGYETVTDITFTVDKDGNVTVEEIEGIVKAIDNKLIVIDKEVPEESFKIEVSKTDLGGKELPGAKIKVTGEDFEEQWTSSDKPRVLYLLPGTYTFHEEVAPEGYETVTDITFEVDEDGNVTVEEIEGIVKSIGNKLIVIDKNKKKKPIKPDIPYTIPKTGVE